MPDTYTAAEAAAGLRDALAAALEWADVLVGALTEPGAAESPMRRIEAARRGEARLGFEGEALYAGPTPEEVEAARAGAEDASDVEVEEVDYAARLGALREWAERPRAQRLLDAMHDRIAGWPEPWCIEANEVLLSV